MIWIWLILLSVVSGCLYRMGGCSPQDLQAEFGWVPAPIRNFPKKRDVGCNLVMLGAAFLVGCRGPWWAWLLSFGLVWASLSTYWDFLFGKDNHFMHGAMIGLSLLPLMFFSGLLGLSFIIPFLCVTMGVWSLVNGNATIEELGRGFFMPISLGLVVLI